MGADRQPVIPCPDHGGAWCLTSGVGASGTAWIVRLDAFAPGSLAPTASDLADAGARSGEALDLFLARRSVLRRLVARRLGGDAEQVLIRYDGQGAPRLLAPRSDHFVSVSGRGLWAGFGFAPRPIGIDLELLEPAGEVPWAVLTASERDGIQHLPHGERAGAFLRHWTAKEAYLKALGTGLLRDPADIDVRPNGVGGFSIVDRGRPTAGQGTSMVSEIDPATPSGEARVRPRAEPDRHSPRSTAAVLDPAARRLPAAAGREEPRKLHPMYPTGPTVVVAAWFVATVTGNDDWR